jgi:hypothetical protein
VIPTRSIGGAAEHRLPEGLRSDGNRSLPGRQTRQGEQGGEQGPASSDARKHTHMFELALFSELGELYDDSLTVRGKTAR